MYIALLVIGIVVFAVGVDAYLATAANLGWGAQVNVAAYVGLPIAELIVVGATAAASKQKLRNVVIALWVFNLLNFMIGFVGGFGFY